MNNSKSEFQILAKDLTKVYYSKYFKTPAIKGINISLREGEFVAVAGPSGSGKSTLLYLLGGLLQPSSGKVCFEGRDITEPKFDLANYRLNSIAFIFQNFNLLPTLSVLENVEYTMLLQGMDRKIRLSRAMSIIEKLGLKGLENRRPNQLSGGQQQRVAIARAISAQAKCILADEPTANLDSHTAAELIHLVRVLNKQEGITFLFATHDEAIINEADKVYRLKDGQILKIEENA